MCMRTRARKYMHKVQGGAVCRLDTGLDMHVDMGVDIRAEMVCRHVLRHMFRPILAPFGVGTHVLE